MMYMKSILLSLLLVSPAVAQEWVPFDGRESLYNNRPSYGDDRPYRNQPLYRNQEHYDDYQGWYEEPYERNFEGGSRPAIAPVAPPIVKLVTTIAAPEEIIIDTSAKKLYYLLNANEAYAFRIAVGKQGFAWTGTEAISRIASWPDWNPPKEMLARRPDYPSHMSGGINNPLGAVAMYLGKTEYRIHGTNDPKSIGTATSSGCIRMLNANALYLASIINVGTVVHVVSSLE